MEQTVFQQIKKKLEWLGHCFFYTMLVVGGQRVAYFFLYPVIFTYVLCSRKIHKSTAPYFQRCFPAHNWLALRPDVFKNVLSFGLTVKDLYTPLLMLEYPSLTSFIDGGPAQPKYSSLPADYSLGVHYSPNLTLFDGLIDNVHVMLDYNDIFDFALNPEFSRHFLLHLGFGLEFTLFDILALRMGLNEGLPALGLGLDLHLFKMDFAMYGRELGTQPGIMPVYNIMIGFDFSY